MTYTQNFKLELSVQVKSTNNIDFVSVYVDPSQWSASVCLPVSKITQKQLHPIDRVNPHENNRASLFKATTVRILILLLISNV